MKLFIFGSTGDLVKRKILPALHKFENLEIYVLGRKNLNNEQYNEEYCKKCSEEFKVKLNYIQISFEESIYPKIKDILDKDSTNYFYISMPPKFSIDLIKKIAEIKENNFQIQVLIEKPFGSNLKESKVLYNLIKKNEHDENIYLSDHYLFKEGILNLKKTRFNKLKITSIEEIGIEGREHYDSVGALKDMIQSHFLNILHKLIKFSDKDIIIKSFERGQYKDYRKEVGYESKNETYIKLILNIKDKEIEFETGKKMSKKESFIEIDGIKTDISSNSGCYFKLFDNFFKNNKELFPTIKNAIINWKIIEKIEENKPEVFLY